MERSRRLPLVVVCLLGLAALPQGAGAAVVGVSRDYLVAGNTGSTYTADRGEVNNLIATTERDASGTTWVVYDDIVRFASTSPSTTPAATAAPERYARPRVSDASSPLRRTRRSCAARWTRAASRK